MLTPDGRTVSPAKWGPKLNCDGEPGLALHVIAGAPGRTSPVRPGRCSIEPYGCSSGRPAPPKS
jgi:hypothetical protein